MKWSGEGNPLPCFSSSEQGLTQYFIRRGFPWANVVSLVVRHVRFHSAATFLFTLRFPPKSLLLLGRWVKFPCRRFKLTRLLLCFFLLRNYAKSILSQNIAPYRIISHNRGILHESTPKYKAPNIKFPPIPKPPGCLIFFSKYKAPSFRTAILVRSNYPPQTTQIIKGK